MRSPRRRRLLVPAALMVCVASLVLAASTQARSSDQGRQLLPGTKPAWTSAVATTGAVSDTQQVRAKVWLAPRNAEKLDALAKAVSDPSSSQYRQYLKPNQYRAQLA